MIVERRRPANKFDSPGHNESDSHPAKKSLGQNFLIDDNISRKIVGALSVSHDDFVIEIGPGRGALTRLLAMTGCKTTGVEKDRHLAQNLRSELTALANVEIVTGDFLEYALPEVPRGLKVVGNIPYNLTARIVSRLVDLRERIDSAVLMVQNEVAARLSARPGTKEYGALSIRLQLVSEVERLFVVTPSCFRPRPRVDSRVVRIVFRNKTPLGNEDAFVKFVKGAFGMRRKMFRNFVAASYGKDSVELVQEKFRTRRVETFTPAEIYDIFATLEKDVRP